MSQDPDSLFEIAVAHELRGLPAVHSWSPKNIQDIDMRIGKDGAWYHQGARIDRRPMVKLFSSILRYDPDGFFLVTPVEKVKVTVDLAPFIAVRMETKIENGNQCVAFLTNVDDVVIVDADHPLWVEQGENGPIPLVRIRHGLNALLTRSVFYELGSGAAIKNVAGDEVFGIYSRGEFFVLGPVGD